MGLMGVKLLGIAQEYGKGLSNIVITDNDIEYYRDQKKSLLEAIIFFSYAWIEKERKMNWSQNFSWDANIKSFQ